MVDRDDKDVFHFHNLSLTIKLDCSNFTIKKNQVLKFLKNLKLQSCVQDSLKQLLLNRAINPEFKFWKRQDERLLIDNLHVK